MSGGGSGIPGWLNVPNPTTMSQMMPQFSGNSSDSMLAAQTSTSPPSSPSGSSPSGGHPGIGGTAVDFSSLLSSPQAMQSAQNTIQGMNAGLLSGLPSGMRASNPAGFGPGFFQNTMGVGKG